MRETIRDTYNTLTLRNLAILSTITSLATFWVVVVGPLHVRRFATPCLIIFSAGLGWKIAREIGEDGLEALINSASVVMAIFAVAFYIGAAVDSQFFPDSGKVSGVVQIVMWSWININLGRALSILRRLSPANRGIVTQSTAAMVAAMKSLHAENNEVLGHYEEIRGLK